MYWTLELASYLEDAPPRHQGRADRLAMRTGAPLEVVENPQQIEDDQGPTTPSRTSGLTTPPRRISSSTRTNTDGHVPSNPFETPALPPAFSLAPFRDQHEHAPRKPGVRTDGPDGRVRNVMGPHRRGGGFVRPNAPHLPHPIPGDRHRPERRQTGRRGLAFDPRPGSLRVEETADVQGNARPADGGHGVLVQHPGPGLAQDVRRLVVEDRQTFRRRPRRGSPVITPGTSFQTKNRSACNASASRAPLKSDPSRPSVVGRPSGAEPTKPCITGIRPDQSAWFARTRRPTSAASTTAARLVPSVWMMSQADTHKAGSPMAARWADTMRVDQRSPCPTRASYPSSETGRPRQDSASTRNAAKSASSRSGANPSLRTVAACDSTTDASTDSTSPACGRDCQTASRALVVLPIALTTTAAP